MLPGVILLLPFIKKYLDFSQDPGLSSLRSLKQYQRWIPSPEADLKVNQILGGYFYKPCTTIAPVCHTGRSPLSIKGCVATLILWLQ